MEFKDARSLPSVDQQDIRHKAVEMFSKGFSKVYIAKALCVTRRSVYEWVKAYDKLGDKGLENHKRGRKKGRQLQFSQSAQIVNLIKNYCPDDLSMPFFLWTRESVELLVQDKFGLKLSNRSVGRYLETWGFSPQKPASRAIKQNQEDIEHWFKVEYHAIQKQAIKDKAIIHWCDEMCLRSNADDAKTGKLTGEIPAAECTGNRFSCNMIYTLTNTEKLTFMVFHKNFTSEVFLQFLKRLIRQSKRKVFLIVDNHPSHKSKIVNEWLVKNSDRVNVYYLPSY